MQGFVGGIRVAEAGTASQVICSPKGMEIGHALRISIKWMSDHKPELHKPVGVLVFNSLVEAFPCSKNAPVPKPAPEPKPETTEENKELRL